MGYGETWDIGDTWEMVESWDTEETWRFRGDREDWGYTIYYINTPYHILLTLHISSYTYDQCIAIMYVLCVYIQWVREWCIGD